MSDVAAGVDALLMDGRIVHVRPVSEGDKDALSALYGRASSVLGTRFSALCLTGDSPGGRT